jgi:N-acetylmuramoyl-L-alanine amidase
LNASKISSTNKLKRGRIQVGQKIVLPNSQKAIYTVKQGDKLNKVAKSLNCSSEELMKLNSLKRKQVFAGQKLIVNID